MGCSSSSEKNLGVEAARRRLSVGHVEGSVDDNSDVALEDDRGLMTQLNRENIIEMLSTDAASGRKFSIGSNTDQGKTSFANKTMQQLGDKVDPVQCGMGFTCRKGLKPESPNQDSWMVLKMDKFSMYGVFDGHGSKGHDVSNFVKETLPKLVIRDQRFMQDNELQQPQVPNVLIDAFKKVQTLLEGQDKMKKIDAKLSGTTATFCVHDHTRNKISMAHVADSTAVLGSWKDEEKKNYVG